MGKEAQLEYGEGLVVVVARYVESAASDRRAQPFRPWLLQISTVL
jgi:hypothetical protein